MPVVAWLVGDDPLDSVALFPIEAGTGALARSDDPDLNVRITGPGETWDWNAETVVDRSTT